MASFKYIFKSYTQDKNVGNSYSFFLISVTIYSLGYLAHTTRYISDKLCIVSMALGLLGVGYFLLYLIRLNIDNRYFRFVFIIYMLRCFYLMLQGFFDFNFAKLLLLISDPTSYLLYVVPLVILIPANIFFVKRMFDYFVILGILLFILFLIFTNDILYTNLDFSEHTIWTLGTGCGFLLLTWEYHNNKRQIIALLGVILSLFISTVMARRNIMVTFGNYILFYIIIILFNSSQSVRNKIYIFLMLLFMSIAGYYVFVKYQDVVFSRISERIGEDSRQYIYNSFMDDMSTEDLIYGKGFNGTYYAPNIEENIDHRSIIESGYLQTILKGGLLSLFLFLLIALPAAFLGLVKSKNILSKASGAIVILWLIDMFPWGMPAFSIRYILMWICIGICFSKEIRDLSDTEIKKSLRLF